jgi:hypothetical protein
MPRFMIEREIPGAGKMSSAELQGISAKSCGVIRGMNQEGRDVQWVHSYVTPDRIVCIYNAPDEATLREHAKRGGFPANRIEPVARIIDPMTSEMMT